MAHKVKFFNVSKTYDKELGETTKPALTNVSFSVCEGEALGLIGANGAGKSTCIRLLMDFIRPDQGQILLNCSSVANSALRHDIGYLPEVASFPTNLTILDLLQFVGATHDLNKNRLAERSEQLLTLLGLWEARKKPLRTYSKGMQQRAGFVLALVHDPQLLILDEPMSGLDPLGRVQIGQLIQDLKAQGKTILFCTHILEDVDRIADRLLILHYGEKRFEGTLGELSQTYGTDTIVEGFLHSIGAAA